MADTNEHLKEFTIDRSKWACAWNNAARNGVRSYLEDREGFKCCLGFYVEACGMQTKYPNGDLVGLPSCVADRTPAFDAKAFTGSSTDPLVNVNDFENDNQKREEGITKLFSYVGVKVNFIGEYLKKVE